MLQQFNVVVDSLRSFLTQLGGYLPRLLGALIILFVGWVVARWIRTRVAAILIFAASVALVQLGIGRELVTSAFQIAFGALCLALALAFGLGGRDWASRQIEKNLRKE